MFPRVFFGCPNQKGKRTVQGVPQPKPQPFPDTKRKRKQTKIIRAKKKKKKRTQSTEISSLFPKRGNRNAKKTKTHKNKITLGKT